MNKTDTIDVPPHARLDALPTSPFARTVAPREPAQRLAAPRASLPRPSPIAPSRVHATHANVALVRIAANDNPAGIRFRVLAREPHHTLARAPSPSYHLVGESDLLGERQTGVLVIPIDSIDSIEPVALDAGLLPGDLRVEVTGATAPILFDVSLLPTRRRAIA